MISRLSCLPAEVRRGDSRPLQTDASVALYGDHVICRGESARVLGRIVWPPNLTESPIRSDYWALEVITSRGSRWFGYSSRDQVPGEIY